MKDLANYSDSLINVLLIVILICWSTVATCAVAVCRAAAQGDGLGSPTGAG